MSSTPRIFVTQNSIFDGKVSIKGSDQKHLVKVLRLGLGDRVIICDMHRTEYDGRISEVAPDSVEITLGAGKRSAGEFPFRVSLFQGIPKGDKLETITQKAVELGIFSVIPVLCERSISRPDNRAAERKTQRLNKISSAAASQCGRGIIPTVMPPVSFLDACSEMQKSDLFFVCYEDTGTLYIKDFLAEKKPESISFLIGPEGGLSAGEITICRELNIPLIGLGKRILRTETASGFVLAAISILNEH